MLPPATSCQLDLDNHNYPTQKIILSLNALIVLATFIGHSQAVSVPITYFKSLQGKDLIQKTKLIINNAFQ